MTRTWRDYNYFLIGCVIVLVGFSLAMVYSATLNDVATHGYFARHLVNLIIGSAAMLLLALLVVVLTLGHVRGGAQSWLNLGLRTFQPSEAGKLLLIVALAAYWAHFNQSSGSWKVQIGGLMLAGIPIGLVFIQPDFGTALVFTTIWLMMAWTAGLRWWQLGLLLVAALPIGYY